MFRSKIMRSFFMLSLPFILGWAGCLAVLLSGPLMAAEEPPRSPASDVPRPGEVRPLLPPDRSEGLPVALVFYDLRGEAGITGGDAEARRQIEKAVDLTAGVAFRSPLAELAVQRVRALAFVRSAEFRLYESDRAGHVVLVVSVEMGRRDGVRGPTGLLTGRVTDFPVLYQDERTLVRLQLDGALGLFTDFHPWFGDAAAFTAQSPIALDPARGGRATWFETSAEYGLAGVRRLGTTPVWAFGAGTFLTSFSAGEDLFRSDPREMTRLEDLYAGVVAGVPGSDWSASLSAGRQDWQLNDGFLFARVSGAANAGPYAGLYLNPRTAFARTVLGRVRWRDVRLEGFYLDPAEIDFVDSNTTYAGVNLAYAGRAGVEASVVYYESPESNTVFPGTGGEPVPRDGLQTVAPRLGSSALFGIRGWELFGEHAWQTHREADWQARAFYVRTGYTFAGLPWKPNLSYRYASFGGDDPDTARYERFDAPLSSGLDTWLQGVSMKKAVTNTNLNSHRVRLNVAPTDRLSFTLDYFRLLADEGSGSDDYGHEVDLGVRWAVSRNLFFLGVAGVGFPGDALEQKAGGALAPWGTVQASLFINF